MKKLRISINPDYMVAWVLFTLSLVISGYQHGGWTEARMLFWFMVALGALVLIVWALVQAWRSWKDEGES